MVINKCVYYSCALLLIPLSLHAVNLIESYTIKNNRIEIETSPQLTLVKELFYADYSPAIKVQELPYTIATIPYIMNVAPLVWLSGQQFELDAMDKDLFNALTNIQRVFRLFFPDAAWNGAIIPKKLIANTISPSASARTAALFSHGLDAVYTSMHHRDEDQVLITVWGSDVMPTKADLWHYVLKHCKNYAQKEGYQHAWVHSNFAYFYRPQTIRKNCRSLVNWFGQVMQACAYTGLAAPIAYATGCSSLLIGSTRTQEYPFAYGTHPAIDNLILFAGIPVEHDGHELDRLEKIEKITDICANNELSKPLLRVCWGADKKGGNCGSCEKCLRTMTELLVLGEDPRDYGFLTPLDMVLKKITAHLRTFSPRSPGLRWHWMCIAKKAAALVEQPTGLPAHHQSVLALVKALANFQPKLSAEPSLLENDKDLCTILWQKAVTHTLSKQVLEELLQTYPPQKRKQASYKPIPSNSHHLAKRPVYTRSKSRANKRGS